MSYMANNFYNAVSFVFGDSFTHLYCAYHFQNAFKLNVIKLVKDPDTKKFITAGFRELN